MCAASSRSCQPGSAQVDCPRCGYDLRGVVAGWVESCPLEGTCAECGLTFDWGGVLLPVLAGLDWCIEFATAKCRLRAVLKTWWRTLRPARFYRALRMTHEVRPRRLLLFAACLILAMYVPLAVAQTWWAWKDWSRWGQSRGTSFAPIAARTLVMPWSPAPMWRPLVGRLELVKTKKPQAWLAGATALAVAPPVLLLMLPISMRLARVRPRHLLRIGVYSAAWVPIAALTEMIGGVGLVTAQPVLVIFAVLARVVIWWEIVASWCVALKRYLRLRENIVAIVTSVNGVLAGLVATSFICTDALADPMTLILRRLWGL